MSSLAGLVVAAGCAFLHRWESSRLCVELPQGLVLEASARADTVGKLDGILADAGYGWSEPSETQGETWRHSWQIQEWSPGGSEPRNSVWMERETNASEHGQECHLRVDIYADPGWPQGELEWQTFYLLRDQAIPAVLPQSTTHVVIHPALGTHAWALPALVERFAPNEALPKETQERIDAYRSRSAIGRWWERSDADMSRIWQRSLSGPVFAAASYFLFPFNWVVFALFGVIAVVGRCLARSRGLRTAGFVALSVALLTPVKAPTMWGLFLIPQGFFLVTDFRFGYYVEEAVFVLAASAVTGVLARMALWLPRSRGRRAGHPSGGEDSRH